MNRKQLEIYLSQQIAPFKDPKANFEQYQTPPRVAANLLHIAWLRGDIEGKTVIDVCAGTGILGLGAQLLGAEVSLIEIEEAAHKLLLENATHFGKVNPVNDDVFSWRPESKFDTVVMNPPFGIQQKVYRDMDFVKRASELAPILYVVHDGSEKNQELLPDLYGEIGLSITEAYIDEFPLSKSYPWHKLGRKIHRVLIIRAEIS